MKAKCKIKDFAKSIHGNRVLSLDILGGMNEQELNELIDRELSIDIKQWRERRSLDANAKSWLLTDRLAEKLLIAGVKVSKEEMHAEMVFRYGQAAFDDDGDPLILSTKQHVKLPEYFPYAKEIGESELNGDTFTHYRIYRASHTYDSKEFYAFMLGIIEECKEQGIETLSPAELERIKEEWS